MSDPKELEKDLAAIRALAEVLDETGLSEVEIERGNVRLRVSKSAPMMSYAPQAAPALPAAASSGGNDASAPVDAASHPGAVTAPMVGTAYLAPSPGAAAFISEGKQVSEGQTLLIIEAMKTMNEIKATRSGTVVKILARDAEPVEYGEPLLIIE
ncbi:acetyl-CoA carboxylase biotin carboxyl carrier protein [Parvularcula sp. LCG005]|uniref:acetyl-CoA carboxylase biotin carboxyl carrier protein n=1 Tax=Parvularcula sp. LCG005 TaxID=3078805 RepID=UPI002943E808|nr:acetyl-CoA carboxylase biotin carboxyl carrier protein [Parvularcula sp. LCG005]WOI52114.1 acetyl-CoA carboxylase biotin carboxyl carrier protein [Parvularcula sp. LCG005]